MKISLEKIDSLNGVITAVVEPEDYAENVKKEIKKIKKEASIPGFRKGFVPDGYIRKRFGESIVAESVNTVLQEKLFNYINEEKINMLGEPIPSADNDNVHLAEGETFTFKFEIAIAPEIEVELGAKDKIQMAKVVVDDELVDRQLQMYRQRGGHYDKVDSYEDNDMLKGDIAELDITGEKLEGGVVAEDVVMLPKYFKNEDQKKIVEKVKLNDTVVFNPSKAYDSDTEIAALLKIDKELVKDHTGDFAFTVKEISRYIPGDLDEDLFKEVFPNDDIKTPEEFTAKVKQQIEERYEKDADFLFLKNLREYLEKKIGEVQFPDEKLKHIMRAKAKSDEEVEENYQKNIDALKWHLIKEKLTEQFEIKVNDEDVLDIAREVTKAQFAQYGMISIPDEYIEGSVKNMLKNRETVDNLIDRAIDMKIADAAKKVVKLTEKKMTVEEFNQQF